MNKNLSALFILAASAASLCAGPLSGRRVPSFALPDANAVYHDILDYRGRIVLLEVMQTSCAHCQTLVQSIEAVQKKYGDKVAILSIVVPPDNADTVRDFAIRFRISYPMLFDCGQAAAVLLKATPETPRVAFPQVLLIDRKGMIREDFNWETDEEKLTGQGLFDALDKLVAETPAAAKAPAKGASKAPAKAAAKPEAK